ncbi:hypothetical protein COHA_006499 [Chlorella ohadii]|uniref:TPX2 C-terminal domain-containing protein n=1 Tax=Chlorella ohadii TaxID=2649997 RepID=A0AAD5H540_9CHLO|nr:hypothetical protein COHA_006499 [Chlorella ohadii]
MHPSTGSSPTRARLASCRSSPSVSARCRSPRPNAAVPAGSSRPGTSASGCSSSGSRPGSKAFSAAPGSGSRPGTAPLHAEASAASSACSRASLASGHSTLLQPTASYVAGVQETRSRKEGRQLAGRPSTQQPKATTPRPFKLSCDERAQSDYTRSSDAFKLTREEREAAEVEKSRQQLAAELSAAKERCRRTLSAQPQRPARSAPHAPEFQEFALRSAARHAAYTQKFAQKVAEERRREDELHGSPSHGSRPSSRIGALHGTGGGSSGTGSPSSAGGSPTGGSPPLLATQERAARHAELSAERKRREEAEVAASEAERLAQLSVAEREEEAERAAHRFKARPMPDFARPVFSPDKRKAKPATTVKEFKFSTRFGAPTAAGAAQDPPSRSASRLRNEGSAGSL